MNKRRHVFSEVAEAFDEFWSAYPKRENGGKFAAKQKFNKLVLSGVPADEIINGARGYAGYCAKAKLMGTEFIAMAKTWLHQRRWEDYAPEDARPFDEAEFARRKAAYEKKIAALEG